MTNSRTKGASGEREFSNLISEHLGVKLLRNLEQSRSGGHDLITHYESPTGQYLNQFAIEVKRYRSITDSDVVKWWKQTIEQASNARLIPILAMRADRQMWRIVLPLSVLIDHTPSHDYPIDQTVWLTIPAFADWVKAQINKEEMRNEN